MYVYGNGRWHTVLRVLEENGRMRIFVAECGLRYPGDSDVSLNKSVLESRFFCARCLAFHRAKQPTT